MFPVVHYARVTRKVQKATANPKVQKQRPTRYDLSSEDSQ
jgi:hypothetical protein